MRSRKFDLYFKSEYFNPKPAKIISYLRDNQRARMEDSYLGMLHIKRSLLRLQLITVPKSTFQLNLQDQVLFNLHIPMQTDQIHIRMQTTRVSRVHVQDTSRLIKLKAAKLRIQEQTNSAQAIVFISV